jgi:N-acetylmuramoyl-L-alanine amidase
MSRRRSSAIEPRSPFAVLAAILRVAVIAVLLALLLIGLGQSPTVANWLAGTGADSPQVGLIAGHWQSDSGAICEDGLREVDLNLQIARRVAAILREEGYRVEVLPEFSAKLNGYRADVLLSIHNDSCIDLSGFKVARMTHATLPEDEDRLVAHLYEQYAAATGLEPHLDTITEDMRQYHAFRQIDPDTPGAIIECGFMGGDRYILTEEQDRIAVGIANGLLAFLREAAP